MMTSKILALGLLLAVVATFSATSFVLAETVVNVSGYEVYLGRNCKINGENGTCGTTFVGWTKGGGLVPDGWQNSRGAQGAWAVNINYLGRAGLGNSVSVTGGSLRLVHERSTVSGSISNGGVTWPTNGGDLGCGQNVAIVNVSGTIRSTQNSFFFNGCLDDTQLRVPRIWGAFAY